MFKESGAGTLQTRSRSRCSRLAGGLTMKWSTMSMASGGGAEEVVRSNWEARTTSLWGFCRRPSHPSGGPRSPLEPRSPPYPRPALHRLQAYPARRALQAPGVAAPTAFQPRAAQADLPGRWGGKAASPLGPGEGAADGWPRVLPQRLVV